MKAIFRQAGDRIDYTPSSDVAAGDVVVLGNRLVAIAALDNLVKGASGQAVQCANIVAGLDETTGLTSTGLYP